MINKLTGRFAEKSMMYRCEKCGRSWRMYLETGLEDHSENHKPVPFGITCKCGGSAFHSDWHADGVHIPPVEITGDMSYFANKPKSNCGVPVLRWKLTEIGREEPYPAILELDKLLAEKNIPHELQKIFDGYIIGYPDCSQENRIGDVVEHRYSYGHEDDLMEAAGFGLPDDVVGNLSVGVACLLFERVHAAELKGKQCNSN